MNQNINLLSYQIFFLNQADNQILEVIETWQINVCQNGFRSDIHVFEGELNEKGFKDMGIGLGKEDKGLAHLEQLVTSGQALIQILCHLFLKELGQPGQDNLQITILVAKMFIGTAMGHTTSRCNRSKR